MVKTGKTTPIKSLIKANRRMTDNSKKNIRLIYKPTGTLLAEGPLGWGITLFEGNYYVQKQYVNSALFKVNFLPGFCVYKFFYVWLDLMIEDRKVARNFAWKYWLPNPLLPFIWFRIAIPGGEADIDYQLS